MQLKKYLAKKTPPQPLLANGGSDQDFSGFCLVFRLRFAFTP